MLKHSDLAVLIPLVNVIIKKSEGSDEYNTLEVVAGRYGLTVQDLCDEISRIAVDGHINMSKKVWNNLAPAIIALASSSDFGSPNAVKMIDQMKERMESGELGIVSMSQYTWIKSLAKRHCGIEVEPMEIKLGYLIE